MPVAKRTPLVTWTDHVARWRHCNKCPLCEQRHTVVLARGTVPCDILFVGEAPGASEDASGLPFVGKAGLVLDNDVEDKPGTIQRALPSHIEWNEKRNANVWVVEMPYALTNLVACMPREAKMLGINEPSYDEILACRPRLAEFVCIARPRLIVRVGRLAEVMVNYTGAKFVDIVHPAAILRMPLAQRQMAAQKSVVVLRNAVADMVEQNYPPFTVGRDEHACITSTGYSESEIPF